MGDAAQVCNTSRWYVCWAAAVIRYTYVTPLVKIEFRRPKQLSANPRLPARENNTRTHFNGYVRVQSFALLSTLDTQIDRTVQIKDRSICPLEGFRNLCSLFVSAKADVCMLHVGEEGEWINPQKMLKTHVYDVRGIHCLFRNKTYPSPFRPIINRRALQV